MLFNLFIGFRVFPCSVKKVVYCVDMLYKYNYMKSFKAHLNSKVFAKLLLFYCTCIWILYKYLNTHLCAEIFQCDRNKNCI